MKSPMVLALACFLMIPMLAISPASAERVIYRANGTLDRYNPDSEDIVHWDTIVVGRWTIKISEDHGEYEVDFVAFYMEKNGPPPHPLDEIEGTLDKFKVVVDEPTVSTLEDDICVIEATLIFHKTGWDPETGRPLFSTLIFSSSQIRIDSSRIEIDLEMFTQAPWEIDGSTLSIHC